jgi:long-chain acyl-CoA synthetase
MQMSRRSLLGYFDSLAQRGEEIAVAERSGYRVRRWSYNRIALTANQLARELEKREIQRGDRVLLWGRNSPEWIAAFWGCVLRGVVVVPMDSSATPEFARRVAEEVDAKAVIAQGDWAAAIPARSGIQLDALEDLLARYDSTPYFSPMLERTDVLEIVFTSGTTAEPRGVVLTHGNLLANLEPIEAGMQKYLRYERFFHPLRFLELLPLSHVFGQMLGIFIPPMLGATVIFQDGLSPADVARTIRSERVTVLVAVPRLIESLKQKIERDAEAAGCIETFHRDFRAAEKERFLRRAWRFRRIHRRLGWNFWAVISGGAALTEKPESFFSRLGFAVVQGYGLTETASLVSLNHPFRTGRGSIGKTLPSLGVKLSETGEILVRGENVAVGYWQGRALVPMTGADGWFHTGDLGALDESGNLYFKGRSKNVIVTPAGMNIYPGDLEAPLRKQPEVRDCVVLGLDRDGNGNAEPCAVLILRNASRDAEAIVRAANAMLAEYQQMRRWFVWPGPDFPRTPTQKPMVHRIREVVEGELGNVNARANGARPLAELIERIERRSQPGERGVVDADLAADLNLSSLDRVELLSMLEERYQTTVSEAGFAAARTAGEIQQLFEQDSAPEPAFAYPMWAQRWHATWIRLAVHYLLVRPAAYLLVWPRVRGRENLRDVRGPILVICNHVTYLDVGFVLAGLPRRLRNRLAVAMDGERLRAMRHPPADTGTLGRWYQQLRYFLAVALFNVFPLPQRGGFRESFAFTGDLTDRGWNVLIFPEGELTPDGAIQQFRSGIGLLATRLGIPVVPIRIDGLYRLRQERRRIARGCVQIHIGLPVSFDAHADPTNVADELRQRVAAL